MGITSRAYIVTEGGSIKRVPREVLDGLVTGQDLNFLGPPNARSA